MEMAKLHYRSSKKSSSPHWKGQVLRSTNDGFHIRNLVIAKYLKIRIFQIYLE